MVWFAAILGGLLLLLLLLLLAPTHVGADYLYRDKKQKLVIRFRVLGIPFSFPVSLDKKEKKTVKKKPEPQKPKEPFDPNKYIELVKNLYDGYEEIKEEVLKIFSFIRKKLSCREVYLTVYYGTQNPATTGMLNGAIWTASSLILKVLDETLGAKKKTLDIRPDFQKPCMCLHIKGTFCFKLIDAVCVVLKIKKLVNIVRSHISAGQKENVS